MLFPRHFHFDISSYVQKVYMKVIQNNDKNDDDKPINKNAVKYIKCKF